MVKTRSDQANISEALRVPFKGQAGQWLAAIAVAGVILELLRGALPGLLQLFIVLPLTLALWVMLFRIASELLINTAHGDASAPAFRQVSSSDGLALRHIGLWLLALLALAAGFQLGGTTIGVIMIALLTLALPAATLLLAFRNSLIDALNPAAALRLVEVLGKRAYLRLSGLLFALALGYVLLDVISSRIDLAGGMQNQLMLVYWAWALLAWFAFAGQLLYEHREALELAPEDEAEASVAEPEFVHEPQQLWLDIQRNGGTQAMHQTLARALDRAVNRTDATKDDHATRLAHGRLHVAALLQAFDRPENALLRADALLDADANFALDQADAMFSLLTAAITGNHHALSVKLCRSYLHNFPHSVRRNEARLRVCEALQEATGSYHLSAQEWFAQLMTETLTPEQRQRLSSIAARYLPAS
ncbi:MAG: hypothetical protein AAF446_05325 [Pseudomonadota bacterium]